VSKRIHHMGMTLAKEEHERWHKDAELTPEQHEALMKKMGISKEEDEKWHRTHLTLREQRAKALKSVNAFAVGGAFLGWCVTQGWLVRQGGKEYYATKDGRRELKDRFGIEV